MERILVFDGSETLIEKEVNEVNWECLHNEVNGYIEYLPFPIFNNKHIDVVLNDEGKLINLPTTMLLTNNNDVVIDYLCGNIVFVNDCGDGNNSGLNDEQMNYIVDVLNTCGLYIEGNKIIRALNYEKEEL